eukprot:TRINITY_DN96207_c0_g1_i1.p1 TRINITY_DN96207_c0_g1~~TRINITY_DN96207_c0_g1_i1.p1  ORF type:complete len:218 (-),score=57.05 TRINITY_DN96207_c0_g1_i1:200-853(-)
MAMQSVIRSSEKRVTEQREKSEAARLRSNASVAVVGFLLLAAFAVTNIVLLQSVLKDPLGGGDRQHRFIGPLLRERLRRIAREGRDRVTGRHSEDKLQTEQQLAWARAGKLSGNGSSLSGHMVQQIVDDMTKKSRGLDSSSQPPKESRDASVASEPSVAVAPQLRGGSDAQRKVEDKQKDESAKLPEKQLQQSTDSRGNQTQQKPLDAAAAKSTEGV